MKLAFKDDTATMPEEAAGLPPLLAVQLWQNPAGCPSASISLPPASTAMSTPPSSCGMG
ncbi:hypothetical protein ACFQU7_21775 [Pseudoroseomonas wenyumeiae]